MSGPGPGAIPWGFELVVFALSLLPLGELLRRLAARRVVWLRLADPIERGLVDLYLAGGALFVIASIPARLYPPTAPAFLIAAGAVGLLVVVVQERRAPTSSLAPSIDWAVVRSPWVWALTSACTILLAVEVLAATGASVGNTYDSSLYTTYVGLLSWSHGVPYSFQPIADPTLVFPQGATVWFAAAQSIFGLPAARASLLVTPLFIGLAPMGAYVWARRWIGSITAGAVVGVWFALVVSWTRVLVSGSNDFVLAFPLVLVLWGWMSRWTAPSTPSWADAIAFGALLGYSAALNPVGAEVTAVGLALLALLRVWPQPRETFVRAGRACAALLVALLFVLPNLRALGSVAGGPPPGATGTPALTPGNFVGLVDPFLFRPTDIWLSPFPALRAELALFLVAGAVLLMIGVEHLRPNLRTVRHGAAALALASVALLATQWTSVQGVAPFVWIGRVTNLSELSVLLFTVFGMVAALPLVALAEARSWSTLAPESPPSGGAPPLERSRRPPPRSIRGWTATAAVALSVALLVPGVVITVSDLPGYNATIYRQFGNVSTADFDLLAWAGSHVPSGSRVLVAPGSAAEFLPGYLPSVRLLYPMSVTPPNGSYGVVVAELTHGRLDTQGLTALDRLGVEFIAVTQANTILWPPFSPAPLLEAPQQFELQFRQGDAYVFAVGQVAPP
ncbi:MAG TPA: hypothetical protein VGV89_06390 [Thermoplasmata archaeon]|nr:hypothetical protein [Thermoplasmata archaeon]